MENVNKVKVGQNWEVMVVILAPEHACYVVWNMVYGKSKKQKSFWYKSRFTVTHYYQNNKPRYYKPWTGESKSLCKKCLTALCSVRNVKQDIMSW